MLCSRVVTTLLLQNTPPLLRRGLMEFHMGGLGLTYMISDDPRAFAASLGWVYFS